MDGFGLRLRKYRKKTGRTQEEFALVIGMSRTGYADLEKDGSGKVFEKLPVIAKAAGCRIDDLFPEMDEESAEPEQEEEESKTARACGFDENEDLKGWNE